MTNEEAIEIIRNEYKCVDSECDIERSCGKCPYMIPTKEPILQAYEMAIQALSSWEEYSDKLWKEAYERGKAETLSQEPTSKMVHVETLHQVMWERDIAIEQLHELGYELGQKIEPCDDAISREAVIEWLENATYEDISYAVGTELSFLPSVTQESGKWIEHPEIETSTPEYLMFYECSECGDKQCFCKSDIHKKRFCSNCGARMVEPQERSKE